MSAFDHDHLNNQGVSAQKDNEQVSQQVKEQVALNKQASSGETTSSKQVKEADQYLSALKTNEHVNENTHDQVAQNEQVSAEKIASSRQIEQAHHESSTKIAKEAETNRIANQQRIISTHQDNLDKQVKLENSQSAQSSEQDIKRVHANKQGVRENVKEVGHSEMSKLDHLENSAENQQLDSGGDSDQDHLNSHEVSAEEKNKQANEHTSHQVALNEQVSAEKIASSRQSEQAKQESSTKIANEANIHSQG